MTPAATAFRAPNMNAVAERFVLSIKREGLNRLILFGTRHLQHAVDQFVAHYNAERPHQGLGNERIAPSFGDPPTGGEVVVDERLGGRLRSYP